MYSLLFVSMSSTQVDPSGTIVALIMWYDIIVTGNMESLKSKVLGKLHINFFIFMN